MTKYQNNRGEFTVETQRYTEEQAETLFINDEVVFTAKKPETGIEEFSMSELGFMMLLIDHAKQDPKFLDAIRKMAAELGIIGQDRVRSVNAARTIHDQNDRIEKMRAALKAASEFLLLIETARNQENAVGLVKAIKALDFKHLRYSLMEAISVAEGPPPGFRGAYA